MSLHVIDLVERLMFTFSRSFTIPIAAIWHGIRPHPCCVSNPWAPTRRRRPPERNPGGVEPNPRLSQTEDKNGDVLDVISGTFHEVS